MSDNLGAIRGAVEEVAHLLVIAMLLALIIRDELPRHGPAWILALAATGCWTISLGLLVLGVFI